MSTLRFRYQTLEFDDTDIHLRTLRDTQEYEDKDDKASDLNIEESNWSLFGVIWPSSKVLAHFMFDYKTENKRILELGCGIGLTSLMLNQQNADITATDYHPEVEEFLKVNTELNDDERIPFTRTGWADNNDLLGKFDLIIGSDVLYERDHIPLLSSFIENHAKEKCEIIIVDPNRGHSPKFVKKMISMGFEYSYEKPEGTEEYLSETFKGRIIHLIRK